VPVPDRVLRMHQSRPAALTHAGACLAARPRRARRQSRIGTLGNLRWIPIPSRMCTSSLLLLVVYFSASTRRKASTDPAACLLSAS
jgi:hypothetical protein